MSHTPADRPFGQSFHAVSPEAPPEEPWLCGETATASCDVRGRTTFPPAPRLAEPLLFGVVFGFLLQKGGVAKFDILAVLCSWKSSPSSRSCFLRHRRGHDRRSCA